MRDASEQANKRASAPVLPSRFMTVLNHSAVVVAVVEVEIEQFFSNPRKIKRSRRSKKFYVRTRQERIKNRKNEKKRTRMGRTKRMRWRERGKGRSRGGRMKNEEEIMCVGGILRKLG